jgi:cytosine/adenosine deaminase-related metal-dependent hydrolase
MALRKFAADFLFTGTEMLGNDAVLIADEKGKIIDITAAASISDGIERYNGIISPGFVNCHCHLELSHMKGVIPAGIGMVEFIISVMNNRKDDPALIAESIFYELRYMKEKGIVAVGDVCNTTDTLKAKSASDLYFHNFIEALGFVPETAETRFSQALHIYQKFTDQFSSTSIVPHAPYSVSDNLFRMINEADPASILSVHNQESKAETDLFEHKRGDIVGLYKKLQFDISHFNPQGSSLQYTLDRITSMHTLLLVHNVFTTLKDVEFVTSNSATLPELWWCLCPNANLYISDRLPDAGVIKEVEDRIVIGTDSLASNTQLNILEELKTLQQHYPSFSTEQLLKWATMNGASALKINGRFGSFEKGKQPGIVVIHGGQGKQLAGTVSRRVL